MSADTGPRHGLQSILSRQLLLIAGAVILANVLFVAFVDASDRNGLVRDAVRRELNRLETAYLAAAGEPGAFVATINGIYDDHPQAYGFALVTADGALLDGKNAALIPPDMLQSRAFAQDWLAWPDGVETKPVLGFHNMTASPDNVSVLFYMGDDPANLVRFEILDEFMGHVLLPLLPIAALLIAGTMITIRRALEPVSKAAAWARSIRPGKPVAALEQDDAPAEIVDLTQAVRRTVERLDAELQAEQRRAAEAAHALRTPAAVLVARLDALPEGPPFDAIAADVRALSRTVTQFLSSSGADRLEIPDGAEVNLNALAQDVVAELAPFVDAQGGELTLSPAASPIIVPGAREAMALALTNLIENAVHHGGPGVVEVTVGPGAEIAVRDHGPGLPSVEDDDLFEPFQRGPKAPRGGAGLGLAIVDRVQRAHGGNVTAEPAPGGGALVRLRYPSG